MEDFLCPMLVLGGMNQTPAPMDAEIFTGTAPVFWNKLPVSPDASAAENFFGSQIRPVPPLSFEVSYDQQWRGDGFPWVLSISSCAGPGWGNQAKAPTCSAKTSRLPGKLSQEPGRADLSNFALQDGP